LPPYSTHGIMSTLSTNTSLFTIETLGCKANQYDSQRLAEALVGLGWREAGSDENPDIVLVNTCTVTTRCSRKCRQIVNRAVRDYPEARVFVTGCYATGFRNELTALDGVAGVFGRDEWEDMYAAIAGADARCPESLSGDFGIKAFSGRSRAMLKIQDGCNSYCSYCIVPYVRGAPRSRALPAVRAEAKRLADAGFREIVITGIHLGKYGEDLADRPTLAEAVETVANVDRVKRVRLSSIKANEVTDTLLQAMRAPSVCPHLHLPLQSGDNHILEKMNRGYTAEEFLHTVEKARDVLSNPAITTDVMVGFPGESKEYFRHTVEICEQVGFSRMHVFPFSTRPGTRAASMGNRIHSKIAKRRSKRLNKLAGKLQQKWADSFVGQEVRVLFEERKNASLCGYTDRYVRLSADAPAGYEDKIARVRCVKRRGKILQGEVVGLEDV